MIDLNKMQARVEKLTKVFTNIINELDSQVESLDTEIAENEAAIRIAQEENETYAKLIEERKALKAKVEGIFK